MALSQKTAPFKVTAVTFNLTVPKTWILPLCAHFKAFDFLITRFLQQQRFGWLMVRAHTITHWSGHSQRCLSVEKENALHGPECNLRDSTLKSHKPKHRFLDVMSTKKATRNWGTKHFRGSVWRPPSFSRRNSHPLLVPTRVAAFLPNGGLNEIKKCAFISQQWDEEISETGRALSTF
jgi:hypothetical protein